MANRGLPLVILVTLLIALGAVYLALQAPRRADQSKPIEVECLRVERGPTLQFERGLIQASGRPVGTYKFLPAVAGKYGPRIEVRGIEVREVSGVIIIEAGNQQWFWPFVNDNTVEIFYYRGNRVTAQRCTQ